MIRQVCSIYRRIKHSSNFGYIVYRVVSSYKYMIDDLRVNSNVIILHTMIELT